MDIWQLNIFCKVIELKSFSKAGQAVFLSQPTVSSHIKELEDYFDCKLIDRLTKEAVPTKAGDLLYGYAKQLISLKEDAETAMSDFKGKIKGQLLIGGSNIPGVYILPKIIGAFTQRFPQVEISLVIGDTQSIINDISIGAIEIGIVGALTHDKKITQTKLIEDEMSLIVPVGHPLAKKNQIDPSQLVNEPFILREHGSGTLKSIEDCLIKTGYGLEDLKIAARMGSTEAVKQGIKNHIGVSILSNIAVSEDIQNKSLTTLSIKGIQLKRSFYLTVHKHRSSSPLNKAFIEFLTQNI